MEQNVGYVSLSFYLTSPRYSFYTIFARWSRRDKCTATNKEEGKKLVYTLKKKKKTRLMKTVNQVSYFYIF